jgi:hypothetical protein
MVEIAPFENQQIQGYAQGIVPQRMGSGVSDLPPDPRVPDSAAAPACRRVKGVTSAPAARRPPTRGGAVGGPASVTTR